MPYYKKIPFNKYALYGQAVQSAAEDVKFYRKIYKQIRNGKMPVILREDFCGAGAISCEWVKLAKHFKSCGLDLDREPMDYGRKYYVSELNADQQKRVVLIKKDVLTPGLPAGDIVIAVNFSYFLFKKREILKRYFDNVYKSLNQEGLFFVDTFGGTQCADTIEDKTKHKNFTYYWDQKNFDPVTNEAYFEIHFGYKGRKYEGIFAYDWRIWSIPEIREIMLEAGFQKTKVYWEGSDKKGNGNGEFRSVEKGESCESWIAYVVGIK